MSPTELVFITGNRNKLAEVQAILGDTVPLSSRSLDLLEIQGTTEDISKDKCRRAADLVCRLDTLYLNNPAADTNARGQVEGPVLVEDTCLAFTALKGLPGPYIKWFLGALGHDGLNNLLAAYEDKSAEAICTFAYCAGPGHEPLTFEGRVLGKIVPARGPRDFGWDPIFEHKGKTYAEMDKVKKNEISHRSLALAKLKHWLQHP
ncbi:MAG: hypothetical protein Q9169_003792 [Polycauliona sp. 2 TL-2023]